MRSWLLIASLSLSVAARAGPDDKQRSQQHYLSGMIYFQAQDYDKADDEWRLAVEIDPSNADAQAGLERIGQLMTGERPAQKVRKPPAKKSKGTEVSKSAKRLSQQHYLSGMIYFQKGDYGKARDEWKRAKSIDPSNDDAQAALERLDRIPEESASSPMAGKASAPEAWPDRGPAPDLRYKDVPPPPPPLPTGDWKDVLRPPRPAGPPSREDFPEGRSRPKDLGVLDNDSSK